MSRRWPLGVIVLGGAAVGAAAVARRRDSHPMGIATGRARRTAAITGLTTSVGANYAVNRARRVFASAARKDELDRHFEMKTAAQVASVLGNMKGALMKVGQMASYLDEGLPEPIREALAGLQQDAPPMSAELAAQVIEQELGSPPDVLFSEWDPIPIAAASIGQVHRAMTKDGRAVAVKVQYPGVDDAIRADLDNADFLFQGMRFMYPNADPAAIAQEIRERISEELDYRLEADNQMLFADFYRGHPFIHIPDVLPELSSGRVLTTELASGARFNEVLQWSQNEKDLAAETIFRFVFRSLYELHSFNGDPHPGNYLLSPGGRVTFLDFGLVKRFSPAEIELFANMADAMVLHPDPIRMRGLLVDVGMLEPTAAVTDENVFDFMRPFYELVLEDADFTWTPEYASSIVRLLVDTKNPVMKNSGSPPTFVIIQRINLGLYALLGQLHATARWRRIAEELWPQTAAGPSTPLGEEEAAWRKKR